MKNLKRRVLQVVSGCAMFKRHEESIEHLFRDYEVTSRIWKYFSWTSENNVDDGNSLLDHIRMTIAGTDSRIRKLYLELTFHACVWGVWLERNRRCFEGKFRNEYKIICDMKEFI